MMGIYNFQARFAPFIQDGRKRQTIRALRAYPDAPGDMLHLYTGLRTRKAKLIARHPCTRVATIVICANLKVKIGRRTLSNRERNQLARRDGFKDFREMMRFWDGRRPFRGQIIHWQFTKTGSPK
jgi:hypothetical protein